MRSQIIVDRELEYYAEIVNQYVNERGFLTSEYSWNNVEKQLIEKIKSDSVIQSIRGVGILYPMYKFVTNPDVMPYNIL